LLEVNRNHGTTLVVVTHSARMARKLGRTLELANGRLHESSPERPWLAGGLAGGSAGGLAGGSAGGSAEKLAGGSGTGRVGDRVVD
jgi:hypothetical protein